MSCLAAGDTLGHVPRYASVTTSYSGETDVTTSQQFLLNIGNRTSKSFSDPEVKAQFLEVDQAGIRFWDTAGTLSLSMCRVYMKQKPVCGGGPWVSCSAAWNSNEPDDVLIECY